MIEIEQGSQIQTLKSSFTRLKGNITLKLLLILVTIDPSLGGLIIFGQTGTGKSEFLRMFQQMKIPLQVIPNCTYHCSPPLNNLCSSCENIIKEQKEIELYSENVAIKKIPLTASIEAIAGNLNLNLDFRPGILAYANNGYILIDDIHLLPKNVLNVIIETWESKINVLQRNSLSISHPSNFCIIASANADYHQLSPAVLDKFAFSYNIHYDNFVEERMEIIDINLENSGEVIQNKEGSSPLLSERFMKNITNAKKRLSSISLSTECLTRIAQLCTESEIQGHRADIALAKGARALASFLGKNKVTREDIDLIAPYILGHRVDEQKKDHLIDLVYEETLNGRRKIRQKSLSKTQSPLKKKDSLNRREEITKLISSLGLFISLFLCFLVCTVLLLNPDVLQILVSLIIVIGILIYLLYRSIRKRQKIMEQYGISHDYEKNRPRVDSFSRVKELHLTSKTKDEKSKPKKEIIIDIEEDYSKKGRIARYIGLQRRRGMISLSENQKLMLNVFGIIILVISLPFFSYLIIILPAEFFASLVLFISCLFMIGYVIQALNKEYRIRRVADIGASPNETSRSLNIKGIGSYISFQSSNKKNLQSFESYEDKLRKKLIELDSIPNKTEKKTGVQLFQSDLLRKTDKTTFRVESDLLPKIQGNARVNQNNSSGKRALSMSTIFSGRVIGSQSCKQFPRNLHILATIHNCIIRNIRKGKDITDLPLSIELEDIREKVFQSRVSATIIFVLDLSQSITNAINAVSTSVSWLSRQAYLYRDRVGIIVMKGTQGVVIQTPTSNLNLVKRKIHNLRVSGSTPLAGGLQKAIELIKLDRVRNKDELIPMIILITDGAANIPLLIDPRTGVSRKTPLKKLGIDRAVRMAIEDSLYMAQLIKKHKISLTIFTTNLEVKDVFNRGTQFKPHLARQYIENLKYEKNLVKTRRFISSWSSMLLQSMQEITNGHLFYISRYQPKLNHNTLRNAREEILYRLKATN